MIVYVDIGNNLFAATTKQIGKLNVTNFNGDHYYTLDLYAMSNIQYRNGERDKKKTSVASVNYLKFIFILIYIELYILPHEILY